MCFVFVSFYRARLRVHSVYPLTTPDSAALLVRTLLLSTLNS
jgi:hypothetical protein